MSKDQLATNLVVLRVLKDEMARVEAEARRGLKAEMDVRERGVAKVPGPDGRNVPVGIVRIDKGSESWRIVDPAAFQAWVEENHPEQIEVVERVRPAFEARILKQCVATGGLADETTGEMIPGVQQVLGDPKLVVVPDDTAAQDIRDAWATGRLSMVDLLAIGGPDA